MDCLTEAGVFVKGFHDQVQCAQNQYKFIGNTDILAAKFSLGGGPLGGVYGDTSDKEQLVMEAVKSGVTYIDTAPWYGQGQSETVLGNALQSVPRQAYFIGTKVGRYEKDIANMFDFSYARTLQSIDTSLKLLQLNSVDLCQAHDIEFAPNKEIVLNETLPALEEAKKLGKIRFIGITGYTLEDLRAIIAESTVKIDTVLSYSCATLHDNSLSKYIDYFKHKGLGVINASATSMGLLTEAGPPDWHPASKEIQEACLEAAKYCKTEKVSISKLAVYDSLNTPNVDTTLVGVNTIDILQENLSMASRSTKLSVKELQVTKELQHRFFQDQSMNWGREYLTDYRENLKRTS